MQKILFIALLFAAHVAIAQQDTLEYNLTTPYQTVLTHLKYLQEDNYYPEIAAKALNPQEVVDKEQAEMLAIKLKQVLDGRGIYIELDDIPNIPNYHDSVTNKQRYYLTQKLPDLYLQKSGDKWYYSGKTIRSINSWHEEVYPLGIDKLLEVLPKMGTDKYFGLHIWQLLGILIIIIFVFALHKLFTFIFENLIINMLMRFGYKELAHDVILPVARPVSILVLFPILILLIPVLQLPITMSKYVVLGLKAVWPVFAIIFFYRLVNILSMYFERIAGESESTLDDQLVPLVRKVLKTFVVIVGVLFILDNLDIDILGIVAGLSIGGLAFALAAQDTIKNFFGSLMIFVDKPFQVGDWITSGDVDGTVEEVGFRSTRIRTFRNSVQYIPNGTITNQSVDNHGLRQYRRFFTQIALTYDTPANLIEVFVEGLKEIVRKHPQTRKDYYEIHMNEMGGSSLNIMFYIFFQVPSWSEELKSRHEILLSIIRLAEELGINFAFPTQTLHVETFPEKKGNSPVYITDKEELKKKMETYLGKN
jgi:MscS family membrane protein